MGPDPIIRIDFNLGFFGIFISFLVIKNSHFWIQKKALHLSNAFLILTIVNHYFLCLVSDETDNFFLPLALLLANTCLLYTSPSPRD